MLFHVPANIEAIRLTKGNIFTEFRTIPHLCIEDRLRLINISQNLCYQTVAMLISAQYYIPKKFRLISSFEGPVGFKRKIKKILNWLSDRWSPGCRAFDDWTVKYVLIYCLSYANFYFQYCRKISQQNCKLYVLGKYQCYIETQSHVAEIHFQFDI